MAILGVRKVNARNDDAEHSWGYIWIRCIFWLDVNTFDQIKVYLFVSDEDTPESLKYSTHEFVSNGGVQMLLF